MKVEISLVPTLKNVYHYINIRVATWEKQKMKETVEKFGSYPVYIPVYIPAEAANINLSFYIRFVGHC